MSKAKPCPGVISQNFVLQVKKRRRTSFGEKSVIQFHQQLRNIKWEPILKSSINSRFLCTICQRSSVKKDSHSVCAQKSETNVDEIVHRKKIISWKKIGMSKTVFNEILRFVPVIVIWIIVCKVCTNTQYASNLSLSHWQGLWMVCLKMMMFKQPYKCNLATRQLANISWYFVIKPLGFILTFPVHKKYLFWSYLIKASPAFNKWHTLIYYQDDLIYHVCKHYVFM